ncbi:hypothetical protein GCM10009854_23410 [Saccharopolyspora halophila]|uniref:Uncharacterized protein n=1 Tax=Saccharopolyspora halophila TaxID=405551 RepID=A0ABN3G8L5_9PSEU
MDRGEGLENLFYLRSALRRDPPRQARPHAAGGPRARFGNLVGCRGGGINVMAHRTLPGSGVALKSQVRGTRTLRITLIGSTPFPGVAVNTLSGPVRQPKRPPQFG